MVSEVEALKDRASRLEEQHRSMEEARNKARATIRRFGRASWSTDVDKLTEWDRQEKQTFAEWAALLFDALILAYKGDEERQNRLRTLRQWFFDQLTSYSEIARAEYRMVKVHQQRLLADALAYALPCDVIDDSWAYALWRGPWMERGPHHD